MLDHSIVNCHPLERRTIRDYLKWLNGKWEDKHEQSFQCLKNLMCTALLLTSIDFTKLFELHIDASNVGLGANNRWCRESHCLREQISVQIRGALYSAQVGIFVFKMERLWKIQWLSVVRFKVSSNPLTYVPTRAKLNARGHRWLAALAAFDFEIEYTPGVSNQDADALSRLPCVRIDKSHVFGGLQPWPSLLMIQKKKLLLFPTFH